ncbi:FHA domain-containing protein [Nocardioides currus]|uniref:Phosphopeptide-binding protein n=1 Tax=Nocardioides currus TaxID=2133958 RepID=A0A2R7YVN3_9ACTN|nr:FHA domain-containing protein [Nocardioides currus]PUA79929.1 phosphopeptide-binding protein [Nocardioides currus]
MLCPAGHESTATDYCDVCGVAMPAGSAAAPAAAPTTPAAPAAAECPNCSAANSPDALFCEACGYDFTTGSMPRRAEPVGSPAAPAADTGNISPALTTEWVAEVWIDPDWYADQESTDPLPSPGLPQVVPLRNTSILIGRASRSRNITPDIDLASDTGISRRHAQLTTDGSRWWVEDLGSSNGTYVGGALDTLPKTPVAAGQKQEVRTGDRIYLGAWTRIVVRKAAAGEV